MLHISLYRARKHYRALVAAVAMELNERTPRADRLADLKARRDAARARAAEIELSMTAAAGVSPA